MTPSEDAELTRFFFDLENRHLDPAVRGDPAAMDALLAEDFVEFGSSGRVHADRNGLIRSLAEKPELDAEIHDFNVHFQGTECALTRYRLESRNPGNGEKSATLRCSLWRMTESGWQLSFHQGTPQIG